MIVVGKFKSKCKHKHNHDHDHDHDKVCVSCRAAPPTPARD